MKRFEFTVEMEAFFGPVGFFFAGFQSLKYHVIFGISEIINRLVEYSYMLFQNVTNKEFSEYVW